MAIADRVVSMPEGYILAGGFVLPDFHYHSRHHGHYLVAPRMEVDSVVVLSLVLTALVCSSGAQHVPAAGVAAAQECCVRNTDNASFLQFHDRNSIRQKKDSDKTGIVGEIPDVACRAGA